MPSSHRVIPSDFVYAEYPQDSVCGSHFFHPSTMDRTLRILKLLEVNPHLLIDSERIAADICHYLLNSHRTSFANSQPSYRPPKSNATPSRKERACNRNMMEQEHKQICWMDVGLSTIYIPQHVGLGQALTQYRSRSKAVLGNPVS